MSWSLLADTAALPERPFLVHPGGEALGFDALAARVGGALRFLLEYGVEPEQSKPVPLLATNDVRSIIALLALVELGVPVLLLHPRWTAPERQRALELTDTAMPPWPEQFAADEAPPELPTPQPSAPLAVVFTSGTSTGSRGVVLSRHAFEVSARASASNLQWFDNDRWLLSLPLAHVGGLSILLRCLLARRSVVLPRENPCPPEALYESLVRERVTLLSLVPTQLQRLLALEQPCPGSLRAVLVGGAPTPPALLSRAADAGYPVLTTYGATECCSQITTQTYGSLNRGELGCGRPLAGYQVRIRGGRIWVRSEALLSGYYPAAAPPLDEEGWFCTQDCGYFDAAGNLHVAGRSDDVIVSGGENVHPEEVEAHLLTHPAIEQACVFGIHHVEWGQQVAAAIVGEIGARQLHRHLASLAAFKRPRQVARLQRLPTTPTGKISRRETARRCKILCRPLLSADD